MIQDCNKLFFSSTDCPTARRKRAPPESETTLSLDTVEKVF